MGYQRRAGPNRTLHPQGAEQVVGGEEMEVLQSLLPSEPLLGLEIDVILMQEM